ncbi:bifunctional hydroxymethylpyrimidine kinase/phosphomethylpyrimidine kinase [Tistrella bauzanensis]|uniref:Bifunctional hydroxymethylpyrimidine kinase/phosphomethylpyrimidine kinase n=1 Tax=Tistrella arctica TaxID=3133430 RepID=A0ABU9YIT2_9PROT
MTGASRAPMRRLLSVDHGDPEGRGGIAFDLKLATACGVYAASAVTAIVADGAAMTVPADIVGGQLRVVLDDIGADALRIGRATETDQLLAISEVVEHFGGNVPLILDPVLVDPSGRHLMNRDALQVLKARLVVRAQALVLDLAAAEVMVGREIRHVDALIDAVATLASLGPEQVVVAGGPAFGIAILSGDSLDVLPDQGLVAGPLGGPPIGLASAVALGAMERLDARSAWLRHQPLIRAVIAADPAARDAMHAHPHVDLTGAFRTVAADGPASQETLP